MYGLLWRPLLAAHSVGYPASPTMQTKADLSSNDTDRNFHNDADCWTELRGFGECLRFDARSGLENQCLNSDSANCSRIHMDLSAVTR